MAGILMNQKEHQK